MIVSLLIGIATAGVLLTRNQELEKADFVEWNKLDIGNPTIEITETEKRIKIKVYKEDCTTEEVIQDNLIVMERSCVTLMKPRYGFIFKFNKTQAEISELVLLKQREIILKEIKESSVNKIEPIITREEIIIKEVGA